MQCIKNQKVEVGNIKCIIQGVIKTPVDQNNEERGNYMKLNSDGIRCYVLNGYVFAEDDSITQPQGRATKTNLETALKDCKILVKQWHREQYCGDR